MEYFVADFKMIFKQTSVLVFWNLEKCNRSMELTLFLH